jgi:hypothetical protein
MHHIARAHPERELIANSVLRGPVGNRPTPFFSILWKNNPATHLKGF